MPNYSIAEIEDQIIATLQANLSNMNIDTSAGQISPQAFLDPSYQQGILKILPFVLVRYAGRTNTGRDSLANVNEHQLNFQLFIGAKTLRRTKEAKLSAYDMLATVFDALHGKWPYSNQGLSSDIPVLDGTQITRSGFKALGGLVETEGEDERLVVDIPGIVVYQTSYSLFLAAYTT